MKQILLSFVFSILTGCSNLFNSSDIDHIEIEKIIRQPFGTSKHLTSTIFLGDSGFAQELIAELNNGVETFPIKPGVGSTNFCVRVHFKDPSCDDSLVYIYKNKFEISETNKILGWYSSSQSLQNKINKELKTNRTNRSTLR